MVETKPTATAILSEGEKLALKEMWGLAKKIGAWKRWPWILGVLISVVAYAALVFWGFFDETQAYRDFRAAEPPNDFIEDLFMFLFALGFFGGIVAGVAALIGRALKFLIYERKIRIAQARLDFLAGTPEGRAALEAVREFLKDHKQFLEFFVRSGESFSHEWVLVDDLPERRCATGP